MSKNTSFYIYIYIFIFNRRTGFWNFDVLPNLGVKKDYS